MERHEMEDCLAIARGSAVLNEKRKILGDFVGALRYAVLSSVNLSELSLSSELVGELELVSLADGSTTERWVVAMLAGIGVEGNFQIFFCDNLHYDKPRRRPNNHARRYTSSQIPLGVVIVAYEKMPDIKRMAQLSLPMNSDEFERSLDFFRSQTLLK